MKGKTRCQTSLQDQRGRLSKVRRPRVLVFLVSLLFACEVTVDPFAETDRYFSMYGYLDAEADTQFVRVVALRDSAWSPAGPIDAQVTFTDQSTDHTTIWKDSVFSFLSYLDPKGNVFWKTGHIFWTTRQPEIGHTYVFEVRRADEATSRATVTVPLPPLDPDIEIPPRVGTFVRRRIVWPEAFPTGGVLMIYHVKDTASTFVARDVVIPYTTFFVMNEETSEVLIDLSKDFDEVYNAFAFVKGTGPDRIELLSLEIYVVKANDEWTFMGSDFDYETLAFPGRYSNVENGLGFLGAVVRSSYFWTITSEEVAVLGYTDGQEY